MPNDLIHYAYEKQARCKHSFYGRLEAGTKLTDFREMTVMNVTENAEEAELATTERITGPLTTFLKGQSTDEVCLSALRQLFEVRNELMPEHIIPTFLQELKESYRRLWGEWTALRHHKTMELRWAI